eukprot:4185654-Karenia_brevis.AAC.1
MSLSKPTRRIRGKTPPPPPPPPRVQQISLPAPLELADEAPADTTRRQAYLVTLSRAKTQVSGTGVALTSP